MARQFHIYILASDSRELYVGITNDLCKRVAQHRAGLQPKSYTSRHKIQRLVLLRIDSGRARRNTAREADQGVVAAPEARVD